MRRPCSATRFSTGAQFVHCVGQQLKDRAQLDGWLRDGSAAHVETLCEWE